MLSSDSLRATVASKAGAVGTHISVPGAQTKFPASPLLCGWSQQM